MKVSRVLKVSMVNLGPKGREVRLRLERFDANHEVDVHADDAHEDADFRAGVREIVHGCAGRQQILSEGKTSGGIKGGQ